MGTNSLDSLLYAIDNTRISLRDMPVSPHEVPETIN